MLAAGIFAFTSLCSAAQINQQIGWFGSFNTIKINSKFSVHAELQVRSTDNWEQVQSVLPRLGLNYHFAKNQILTAGYAFIPTRNSIGGKSQLLGEHRIWQQYIINQSVKNTAISHRFRLEERFIPRPTSDGTTIDWNNRLYSTRLRYFIRAVVPLVKDKPFTKGVFIGLQNEIFTNLTDQQNVNTHFFDQNRAYAALGYRFSKKFDIEAGYMNQFIKGVAKTGNRNNHIIQLATYLRL